MREKTMKDSHLPKRKTISFPKKLSTPTSPQFLMDLICRKAWKGVIKDECDPKIVELNTTMTANKDIKTHADTITVKANKYDLNSKTKPYDYHESIIDTLTKPVSKTHNS